MKQFFRVYLCLLTLVFAALTSVNAAPVKTSVIRDSASVFKIENANIGIYTDVSNRFTFEDIRNFDSFKISKLEIPNLGVSSSSHWIKFSLLNKTNASQFLLNFAQPTIDSLEFYEVAADGTVKKMLLGEYKPFEQRPLMHCNFVFYLIIPPGQEHTIYMKVRSGEQIMVPLSIGVPRAVSAELMTKDLIFGLYIGIIVVMFLYNIFVYYSVRDKSYLYYVIYILLVGLLQTSLHGYTFKYLWPNSPWMAIHGVYIFTCLTPIAAVPFFRNFLQIKQFIPRYNRTLNVLIALFIICLGLALFNVYNLSFTLMQLCTLIMSISLLVQGVRLWRKGYRPAKFFLIAWSIFLLGVFIFILKDFGILPYNDFTFYMMPAGSALETILLSFALADKINILRKEKEESQAKELVALEEINRMTAEQNTNLERKVNERTLELKVSNEELNKTLHELKEAETQLVESEKMASLGQLTAGIAHEINNPINFVTSNVKPLKRDVEMVIAMISVLEEIVVSEDSAEVKKQKISSVKEEYYFDELKIEIDELLKGITEGSTRTAEIVKGLRIFSRLDEDDLKKASINEGLDSTLIIINNLLDNKIKIQKEYGNIPMVECYPGKLNQVFLNIITNGIHAIKAKFKDTPGGLLTIATTINLDNTISVTITDNGTGMDEQTKRKLFEPFFTTKDVGEGTGLGLSIAYNTIRKHNGVIVVNSAIGEGTSFILTIPVNH